MQEHNTEETKDRIPVYPYIALRFNKRQHEGDATQLKPLVSYCEPVHEYII
jgi:hypothetical protein